MAVEAGRSWCALGVASLASVAVGGCLDRPLAETHPETTNVIVMQLKQAPTDKVDLLFMIDNSMSMSDKQAMLADAVPALVRRLISPRCVDPITHAPIGGSAPCANGVPEFRAVEDIHVGVISSSIGGHGADYCSSQLKDFNPTQDDGAHLLGERRGLGSNALGFLAWTPELGDPSTLVQDFALHVTSAGQEGCGYEASLESWYRFLIDPEPPLAVVLHDNVATPEGIDQVVLEQRAQFLRPDSLVAVIMLSDENDCSIIDGGNSWYVGQSTELMWRSTAVCADHPNDVCCRSCGSTEAEPPSGCTPLGQDPGCTVPRYDQSQDDVNLRCWDQKRRFGIDFLYPVERYVAALTQPTVKNRSGEDVKNPLFTEQRDKSLIFAAGILGVPWQDIASQASLAGDSVLSYLSAKQLSDEDRWSWLIPDGETPPRDPLMIESRTPRSGLNPAINVALTDPGAQVNPINGSEWMPVRDLQYACIYPLATPRDCTGANAGPDCDCSYPDPAEKKPLCRDPATGTYGSTQYFAKAYPGTRQLRVLEGAGENAIVASICPKVATGDSSSPSYGYNPAVDTIVDRFGIVLTARCMPRQLEVEPDGTAKCAVVESLKTESSCACDASQNRKPVSGELATAVHRELKRSGKCGGDTGRSCDSLCMCEIGAASEMASCQNDPVPSGTGWCYVDPDRGMGNPALVAECPAGDRRLVRFAGDETPAPGADVFIACLGAPLGSD